MMNTEFLDPSPDEWINDDNFSKFSEKFSLFHSLLEQANVLEVVVKQWITNQLIAESNNSSTIEWARNNWSYRLDSLYLERKEYLDRVSCRLIRVTHSGLALELYHRLMSKESSFEEIAMEFSESKEKFKGGLLGSQPLANFPKHLQDILKTMEPLQISKPVRLDKKFLILQLVSFEPCVRSVETENQLLGMELEDG